MGFRKDFLWGVASASYQVEGAAFEDGKGLSVWDVYTHEGGYIREGDTGDIACDHYHRYEEDVRLMAELGTQIYRFSVSWARILPDGIGKVNQAGIDFYNKLIDSLIANHIEPCLTLFHWDLPYELEKRGAWLNPESPDWFEYYARVCAEAFGDRCKVFFTFNEPQCFIGTGYFEGSNAPGRQLLRREIMPVVHNVLLAHGKAVKVIRDTVPGVKIGYAPTNAAFAPATDSPEDIEAARRAYFKIEPGWWMWNVPLFSDPVILGRYPEEDPFFKDMKQFLPDTYIKDIETICQPIDYYGQNIYYAHLTRMGENGEPERVRNPLGMPKTCLNWSVSPYALYWAPKFLYERYKMPIIITENGMACHDAVSLDGKVHDPNRIDFTHRYLRELRRAADDGVDIAGYMHWTITDDFEWRSGFTDRFGLIYIDFNTQERIPKDSFYWYRDVIKANGENL